MVKSSSFRASLLLGLVCTYLSPRLSDRFLLLPSSNFETFPPLPPTFSLSSRMTACSWWVNGRPWLLRLLSLLPPSCYPTSLHAPTSLFSSTPPLLLHPP